MVRILFALFILISSGQTSYARPVIADLSLRMIEIDSGFTGTEILLFGARNDAGDIVVVIRGPESSYVVRKKERVAGIWVNKQNIVFNKVNGFYAAATSRPLSELRNDSLLKALEIGMDNLDIKPSYVPMLDEDEFTQAFLDKQMENRLYSPAIEDVSFIGDTLFRTIINFPENIIRGVYTAEIYLFSDGQLIGMQSTPLVVRKKGFDAFVFDFAYNQPLLYGVMAVIMALVAGWVAGAIFRKV